MDIDQIVEDILYETVLAANTKIDEKIEEYRTKGANPDEIYMALIDDLDVDHNALTEEVLNNISQKMEQSGAI